MRIGFSSRISFSDKEWKSAPTFNHFDAALLSYCLCLVLIGLACLLFPTRTSSATTLPIYGRRLLPDAMDLPFSFDLTALPTARSPRSIQVYISAMATHKWSRALDVGALIHRLDGDNEFGYGYVSGGPSRSNPLEIPRPLLGRS